MDILDHSVCGHTDSDHQPSQEFWGECNSSLHGDRWLVLIPETTNYHKQKNIQTTSNLGQQRLAQAFKK